jgi:hypothetical protein
MLTNRRQGPALTSAVVLLTRMWSAKLTGTGEVPAKDLGNVYTCMLVLKQLESQCVDMGSNDCHCTHFLIVGISRDVLETVYENC